MEANKEKRKTNEDMKPGNYDGEEKHAEIWCERKAGPCSSDMRWPAGDGAPDLNYW